MCSQRTKDYRFSYEKMLNFKGNTASYMLYSYARISNIVRKAEIKREDLYLKKHLDNFTISEAPERVILLTLLKFDSVINEVAKDLMPHHICEWMYSLSGNFTEFYEKCRVIQTDGTVNISRMILCEMVRKALDISFHLLGLKAIDRMWVQYSFLVRSTLLRPVPFRSVLLQRCICLFPSTRTRSFTSLPFFFE